LAQVPENIYLKTFKEAFSQPKWDATMNEDFCSLMMNDTRDIVPLPRGRKLVKCK
jgi:hypothetical protein